MSQPTMVNHAALNNLAHQMDDLSQRACDVLQRYLDLAQHAHGSQILNGGAGDAHLNTTAQIHEAQMKIQNRFQAVNDLLRQGGTTYAGADEDNKSQILGLHSHIQFT